MLKSQGPHSRAAVRAKLAYGAPSRSPASWRNVLPASVGGARLTAGVAAAAASALRAVPRQASDAPGCEARAGEARGRYLSFLNGRV